MPGVCYKLTLYEIIIQSIRIKQIHRKRQLLCFFSVHKTLGKKTALPRPEYFHGLQLDFYVSKSILYKEYKC